MALDPKAKKFLRDSWSSLYPPEFIESLLNVEFAGTSKTTKQPSLVEVLEKSLGKMRREF